MTDLNDLTAASNENQLVLDELAQRHLAETSKWSKFLSIMGFIGSGLLVLLAFFMGTILSIMPSDGVEPLNGVAGAFGTVFYLLFAALYFYPSLLLYRFATRSEAALRSQDQNLLNDALDNQRSMYKFIGILTIITIGIYVLIILGGLLLGASML